MISAEVIRGYIDVMVLESLLDEPSYGYAISRRIECLAQGQYDIKETTLYSALRRLEKSEYVESFKRTADNGRPRTYYQLTNAGRQHYATRIQEWFDTGELVRRFIRNDHLPSTPVETRQ